MLRIIQITEKDKMELGEKAHYAVKAVHQFLECLDKVSEGQISQEMPEYYGERRGVPGTGRYSRYNRRDGGYGERGDYDMRDGEHGYGNYGNRYDY